MKVSTELCQQLAETLLSFEQRIVLAEDGIGIVQASVPDSMPIRNWRHSLQMLLKYCNRAVCVTNLRKKQKFRITGINNQSPNNKQ